MRGTPSKLAIALLLGATTAHAQSGSEWDGDYDASPATRRSEVVVGAFGGAWLASASGYPNEADKLDNPAFEAETGFGVGGLAGGFVGGALRDWLSVGLGGFGGSFQGDLDAGGFGFLMRIESYPLFALGGPYRDLSLFGNFGIGSMTLEQDAEQRADGGSMSVLGVGAFWEAWRPGPFALGPSLEYLLMDSQTVTLHSALVGVRVAVYGGPGAGAARPASARR